MNTTEESKERILSNHFFSVKNLTMDGMWVVLLFISGLFKIEPFAWTIDYKLYESKAGCLSI